MKFTYDQLPIFFFLLLEIAIPDLYTKTLPQANEIATNLRRHLEPESVAFHFDHWLTRARNHTAGILAYFLATQP